MLKGGTQGNEQLTAQIGVVLLVLLAALGVTIPDLRQLVAEHLFIGMLLLVPVAAKMGSTGYRFIRYYTGNPAYRKKGPPHPVLRTIAPIVLISTLVVFITGVLLLFAGPDHRNPLLEIHKLSFIVWLVFMALHVLGHLLELPGSLRATRRDRPLPGTATGSAGRWITLVGSVVGGVVLAIALIPQFSAWTQPGVFRHHHHKEREAAISTKRTAVSSTTRARVSWTDRPTVISRIAPRVTRG